MFGSLKKRQPASSSHEPDRSLIWGLGLLVIFGLVMLFSASWVVSYAKFGNTYHYLLRQLASLAVALVFFFITYKVDYHFWKKYAKFFLIFYIILLILVFIPGLRAEYGTARSWINIFGQSFQPAELVKVSFLIYLATWLEAKKQELKSLAEKGRIEDVVGRLNSEIELTPHEKKHFNNVPSEVVAKWFENKNGEDEDNKNNKK